MKHLGFLLNLIAIGLFVPGVLLPILHFDTQLTATLATSNLNATLVDKTLSIWTTIKELWHEDRYLVSVLIFGFSIAIPVIKTFIVGVSYFAKQDLALRLSQFVSAIGKWSMADVFVVAIFLVVLSTHHSETKHASELSMFGFKFEFFISSQTLSSIGPGFYYFTGYCLLSLLASQLLCLSQTSRKES